MPTSTLYQDIADALKARLESQIVDLGPVHTRIRRGASWPAFLDAFKLEASLGEQLIRGFMITRSTIDPVPDDTAFGRIFRSHLFSIHGIMAFSDADETASEAPWQHTVDDVLNALDTDTTLSTFNSEVIRLSQGRCRVTINELRMFGALLAHYCEIQVTVETERSL